MTIFYPPYCAITSGLFMTMFPAFWVYTRVTGNYHTHLKERLGLIPVENVERITGHPRIWMHAVSLGEVKVAAALISALKPMVPGASFIVSTMTEHGRKMALDTFGEEVPIIYAPFDLIFSVRMALSFLRPDVVVFLETEIWPSWVFEAHRMGIKTALINGRISVRSIKRYLRLRPFFREVLKNFDLFSMILKEDASRIRAMGANPRKITINGNAKYDLLGTSANPDAEIRMRRILNLEPSDQVLIAGSTREGEEEIILGAYREILKKFPEMLLIIAPRHIERARSIGALVKKQGLLYQMRTDLGNQQNKRTAGIVIFNTFGELFNLYSVATIVFCGASMVPLGGQNPLEPAIWGKQVFYGSSMEDFMDAKFLLENVGAGTLVKGPHDFAKKAIWFLENPQELKRSGERGRQAVLENQGAAKKHARMIALLLEDKNLEI